MPDHAHIILERKSIISDLRNLITAFKQRTGWLLKEKTNNKYKWQKDFYDHIHRKDEDLIMQVKYIAENPVRKKMVFNWQEYKYIGSLNYNLKEILESE